MTYKSSDEIEIKDPRKAINTIKAIDNVITAPWIGGLIKKNIKSPEWKRASDVFDQLEKNIKAKDIKAAKNSKNELIKILIEEVIPQVEEAKQDVSDLKRLVCLYVGLYERAVSQDANAGFLKTNAYKIAMGETRTATWEPYLAVAIQLAKKMNDADFSQVVFKGIPATLLNQTKEEKQELKKTLNEKTSPKTSAAISRLTTDVFSDLAARRVPEFLDRMDKDMAKLLNFTEADFMRWNNYNELKRPETSREFEKEFASQLIKIKALDSLNTSLTCAVDLIKTNVMDYIISKLNFKELTEEQNQAVLKRDFDFLKKSMKQVDNKLKIAFDLGDFVSNRVDYSNPLQALGEIQEKLARIKNSELKSESKGMLHKHIDEAIVEINAIKTLTKPLTEVKAPTHELISYDELPDEIKNQLKRT